MGLSTSSAVEFPGHVLLLFGGIFKHAVSVVAFIAKFLLALLYAVEKINQFVWRFTFGNFIFQQSPSSVRLKLLEQP